MPPRSKIEREQYNAFSNALGHRFLVSGFFNAKHQYSGSALFILKGRELYHVIQRNQLEITSTGEKIYWKIDINKTSDLLYFFILKGLSCNSLDIRPDLQIASDHKPVNATVNTRIETL
jgi:hypothetical protein